MGKGYERGLELARGEVDAPGEHLVEEVAEPDEVALFRLVEVGDDAVHEEQRHHRAHALGAARHPRRLDGTLDALLEGGSQGVQPLVGAGAESSRSVARPAATEMGFPDSVPAW